MLIVFWYENIYTYISNKWWFVFIVKTRLCLFNIYQKQTTDLTVKCWHLVLFENVTRYNFIFYTKNLYTVYEKISLILIANKYIIFTRWICQRFLIKEWIKPMEFRREGKDCSMPLNWYSLSKYIATKVWNMNILSMLLKWHSAYNFERLNYIV